MWLLTGKKSWLMGSILRHQSFINSTDASGMVVLAWELPMMGIIKQWLLKSKSETWDTMWFQFGNALTQNSQ